MNSYPGGSLHFELKQFVKLCFPSMNFNIQTLHSGVVSCYFVDTVDYIHTSRTTPPSSFKTKAAPQASWCGYLVTPKSSQQGLHLFKQTKLQKEKTSELFKHV